MSMPLGRWLVEDRAEPEAMAVCRPPHCGPGLVVTVLRLRGQDARAARAVLADPQPLVRTLRAAKRNGGVQIRAQAHTLRIGVDRGFTLAMERADGSGKPVHGAAVGRPSQDGLHLVIVIGEDSDAVESTLRRVAAEHLGS